MLRPPYWNGKGQLSQNVFAAVSIDRRFVYILSGLEGNASDNRVYDDARGTNFKILKGRYYLADAIYANSDDPLVPYLGVRYHLKDWEKARERYASTLSILVVQHQTSLPPSLRIIKNFSTTNTPNFAMSSSSYSKPRRSCSKFFQSRMNFSGSDYDGSGCITRLY